MRQKYDKDGDGKLSEEERATLRKDMEKRRAKEGDKHSERPTREQIMQRFDVDGDGELSEKERIAMREAFEVRRAAREQQGE